MELCDGHRDNLTAENFPERVNTCGCKFNRYVSALFEAVSEGSSVAAYVNPRGGKSGPSAPVGTGDGGSDGSQTGKGRRKREQRKKQSDKIKQLEGDLQKAKAGSATSSQIPWHTAGLQGPPAPAAPGASVAQPTGAKAKVRGDIPQDEYEHPRVSGKTFGNRWAVLSYSQTGEMCRKLGVPLVCTRHLSAIGCKQPGCKFTHE